MSVSAKVHIIDYVVLAVMLLLSLGIGLFYSCRQKTAEEYLHGGHKMALIPVSVSLVVSFISAITMQGLTAEVYLYGIDIIYGQLGIWGMVLVAFTFLPILYEMKPTSIYQYLEERYQSKVPRMIGSTMSMIALTIYSGVIIFGPASALENFLGISTQYNIVIMVVICTIYTSLGGIRAVVWTDVLQSVIMIIGLMAIIVVGLYHVGLQGMWYELSSHGRTHIEFNPDITQRFNFWIGLVAMGVSLYEMFMTQTAMMRYTGLPTQTQAKISVVIGAIGCTVLMSLAVFVGAVVFAYYAQTGCGPLGNGIVSTPNQIIPYFVITVINFPGVPGIFVSAIVSSTLSSLSSAENSVTAIFWKDILSPHFPNISELQKTIILKLLVAILGVVITAIALAAMHTGGTIFQINAIAMGVLGSPLLGMFLLGACSVYPSALTAIIGWVIGASLLMWISIGSMIYGTQWEAPPLLTDNCSNPVTSGIKIDLNVSSTSIPYTTQGWIEKLTYLDNDTLVDMKPEPSSGLLQFYSISPYCYTLLGVTTTVIVGLTLSLFPCLRHKGTVNTKLLFPCVRKFTKLKLDNYDEQYNNIKPPVEPLIEMKT